MSELDADDQNGLRVLALILIKRYRPSHATVECLCNKMDAMDLTKYPAENVSLLVRDVKEAL